MTKTSSDYELSWPRALFQSEASALLNRIDAVRDWASQAECLLDDAFGAGGPLHDFQELKRSYVKGSNEGATNDQKAFIVTLLRQAASGVLREETERAPYYSQRQQAAGARPKLSLDVVAQRFCVLINDLSSKGYFERVFGKDCVDSASEVIPAQVIEARLGVAGLWPLDAVSVAVDDMIFDLTEVFYDLVARPRSRWYHDYGACGFHHSRFSVDAGRALYVWRVNRLLEQADFGLRLAGEGEDAGRLVSSTSDGRDELVDAMIKRTGDATVDPVRHAIAQFRRRGASDLDKRSAILMLAGVLEERRPLIKAKLFKKDEGALFTIANEFGIRHQHARQQKDYNPLFLDWIFWWYLATIELTDRLMASQSPVD